LRTVAPSQALRRIKTPKEAIVRIVRGIYRYPIKGLSPQPVRGIVLEEGKPFPFDRVFALARPGVPIDASAPRWAKKGLFLMLMLDDTLARVQTHVEIETMQLTVRRQHPTSTADRDREECVLSDICPSSRV